MITEPKKWSWKMVADLFISCYIPIAYVYIIIYIYTQTIGVAKLDITNYRDLPISVTTTDLVPL